jgi:hypothetical protein
MISRQNEKHQEGTKVKVLRVQHIKYEAQRTHKIELNKYIRQMGLNLSQKKHLGLES